MSALPRRWTRPLARPMVRRRHQLAAPSSAASQAPPRLGQVRPPARTDGQSGPGEPPVAWPAASRTSPPATLLPFLRCRRLAPAISVGLRPDLGRGPVRPADCRAVRDLGVAPGFRARVTTRSRPLRAWASRAHLGPAPQIRPGWWAAPTAVPRCREAGQACPACRGRIPP